MIGVAEMTNAECRMSKWHFEDPEAVTLLRKEANEWLYPQPTPFRKFGCAKGPGGGVYCVAFARALMEASGACKPGEFKFPHDDSDYASANTMRRIMRSLLGQVPNRTGEIDPESKRLAEIFERIPIYRELRAHHDQRQRVGKRLRKPGAAVNIPASLFMPGDLLILRSEGLFHIPVMLGGRKFVSAIPGLGVREGNLHDTTYSYFIAGVFRARSPSRTG